MTKLVRDDPGAAPDDMVLEVDRVEDARTVRELFRIPAAQSREFLAAGASGAAPTSVELAYGRYQDFWDWLAQSYADLPPEALESPGAGWLIARYHDWQSRA
jgi:hypothetical protein